MRNIYGWENLTFKIYRLDLLADVVNELSLFFNKNPSDIKIQKSKLDGYIVEINF